MRLPFLLVITLLLSYASAAIAYKGCIHDTLAKEMKTKPPLVVPQAYPPRFSDLFKNRLSDVDSSAQYLPMRIHFNTDTIMGDSNTETCYTEGSIVNVNGRIYFCRERDVVTLERYNIIMDVIDRIKGVFGRYLNIIRVVGNLKVGDTCARTKVPSSYRENGVPNTDLVIMVSARPRVSAQSGVLADAINCQTDQAGRPTAGYINFNPSGFFADQYNNVERQRITIHEIFHILGFSSNSYSTFKDENGETRGLSNVVKPLSRTFNGHTISLNMITTPKVRSTASKHYQCSEVEGVELEDAGGSGTAGSHWESTRLYEDIMVGSASWSNPGDGVGKISEFTLSIMEDSGWYKPNYDQAEKMIWGKRLGCNFLSPRCSNWNLPSSISGYFCSSPSIRSCTFNHRYKGHCQIFNYHQDLGYYAYFTDNRLGGMNPLMDYCPIIMGYANGDCKSENSVVDPLLGEKNGHSSRCFESTLVRVDASTIQTNPTRCFETKCDGDKLYVGVNNNWYPCPEDGGILNNIPLFTGTITCPKKYVICSAEEIRKYEGIGTFSIGNNDKGQLGVGGVATEVKPTIIHDLMSKKVSAMSAGNQFSLVQIIESNERTLYGFGHNHVGQIGMKGRNFSTTPTEIQSLKDVIIKSMCSGDSHSIIVTSTGVVYGFGDNSNGQLGMGSSSQAVYQTPTIIPSSSFNSEKVVECACGERHSICLTESNRVYLFGSNSHGQIGISPSTPTTSNPMLMLSLSSLKIDQVAAGGNTSFAVTNTGSVYSWGSNEHQQLGVNNNDQYNSTARQITSLQTSATKVIPCPHHVLIIGTDSKLYGFGNGLLHADITNPKEPAVIDVESTQIDHVSCGKDFSLVIASNKLYAWGNINLKNVTNTKRPTYVENVVNFEDVSHLGVRTGNINSRITSGYDHSLIHVDSKFEKISGTARNNSSLSLLISSFLLTIFIIFYLF